MSIWLYHENKYIAEATVVLEKTRYDLSVAKIELMRIESDLAQIPMRLNELHENLVVLKGDTPIVSMTEYRKSKQSIKDLQFKYKMNTRLHKLAMDTVLKMEQKIADILIKIEKLRNNVVELKREN